jgi:hypothetical protein
MLTTEALWIAVDLLTKPTRVQVARTPDKALTDELAAGNRGVCDVTAWRSTTTGWATVPSLWDQATAALTAGLGASTGSKPFRERSPCDVDLMEIRGIIRDTTRRELIRMYSHLLPRTVPGQIRRLASVAVTKDPEHTDWWVYRFESWGRLLETYLNLVEHQGKPTRLRGTSCPVCGSRVTLIEGGGGVVVAPALIVEYRYGYVRSASCGECGHAWFRGQQLEELARLVNPGGETA